LRNGMYREALDTLARADAAGSDDPGNAASPAMACFRTGRRERARAELERAKAFLVEQSKLRGETSADDEQLIREAEALVSAR
jgi:Flp pilus assembly protein TadD